MAADAYLKTAAGQLQQGADALRREARHIRGEGMTHQKQLENQLVGKQAAIKAEQLRAQGISDDRAVHGVMLNVQRLQNDADDLKRQIDEISSQTEQQAQAKESAGESLTGQAQNLQQMSADPRLR